MRIDLGGPGPACSATRVRRLLAGELAGAEGERVAQHLAACARCQAVQREIAQEKAELARAVPFEAFAAGVAEKLALGSEPRARKIARWVAPLAAAAAVALVAGAALVHRPLTEESGASRAKQSGAREKQSGVRSKGGASAQLFVLNPVDARGVRELGVAEPVAQGARLQIFLHPSGRKYAAAVLVEPGESTVLYSGPAVQGALPQSFEWTGAGQATLLLVLADAPMSAERLHSRADAPPGADIVQVSLHR